MNRFAFLAVSALLLGSASLAPALSTLPPAPRAPSPPVALPAGHIDILSYNVKGLPWPLAGGRPQALATIGDRLAALRAAGRAPQVVVLQEAFTGDARAIAARSGYRYVAFGPEADTPRPDAAPPRPDDYWRGEGLGAWLSSGLVLLSDYPLSDIRRSPFPDGACSGYDCLANKGMLAARLHVPGRAQPVEIVTTHLNSGAPSGQPESASRAAYAAQLRALRRFLREDGPRGADSTGLPRPAARIIAGDFNVGHSPQRLALLMRTLVADGNAVATAQGRAKYAAPCHTDPAPCRAGTALAANVPLTDANDWQFYAPAPRGDARPIRRTALFGPDAQGAQLSDHQGLMVRYRLD